MLRTTFDFRDERPGSSKMLTHVQVLGLIPAALWCPLTFLLVVSLLGCVLPLFLDDGQSGEVGPGLIRLPLQMELHVALL